MPGAAPVAINVTVNPRDIARINKRLSKWQGAELKKRTTKAIEGGLRLMVGPMRLKAPRRTGGLAASVQVKAQRPQQGEIVRRAVYPTKRVPARGGTALLTALLVHGANNMTPRPFVDEVAEALEPTVTAFISEQITRLA